MSDAIDTSAMTEQEQMAYIRSKLSDKWWRMNNLYMIENEQGKLVRFRLRPAQELLVLHLVVREPQQRAQARAVERARISRADAAASAAWGAASWSAFRPWPACAACLAPALTVLPDRKSVV